jgi:hypothetical protein
MEPVTYEYHKKQSEIKNIPKPSTDGPGVPRFTVRLEQDNIFESWGDQIESYVKDEIVGEVESLANPK